MKRWITRSLSVFVGILLLAGLCLAQEIVLTPNKTGGVYETGEKIQWRVELRGDAKPAPAEVRYVLKKGGLTVLREGAIDMKNGAGSLEASLDEPGTILAEVKTNWGDKSVRALAGAAVAPEKIRPSAPRPDDFDSFWKAKIDELNAVPINAVVEPAESGQPNVEYYKVRLDNIHGTHVYGQLARPKREGKFPALLMVQYAGVYPLPKSNVIGKAAAGWLALNIMAHDLPFDQPQDFYSKLMQTTLKDYPSIGKGDREKSYFLRMCLGCYRAADYLAQRPDWNGQTLAVTGGSQGGLQTLVTAAIYPKITALMANVPAGCDSTGSYVGRAAGWPYTYVRSQPKTLEAARYFDLVNFASRIKCPALVALGLIDETCPPAGVFAAFNQLQGPKEVVVMVNSDHQGKKKNAQARFYSREGAWERAMLSGKPVPVDGGPARPAAK